MKLLQLKAIEVLDSRGNPTLRTIATFENNIASISTVPSGASTGTHEALELRDQDNSRYNGQGVIKAINNVNDLIAKKIVGQDISQPDKIDELLINLDNTEKKSHLGANAILSVSQALIKGLSIGSNMPLWQYINQYYFTDIKPFFPKPMFNVVNGGKHAGWNFDIQEFIIIPQRQLPSENIKIGAEIYQSIKKNLKSKGLSTLVGDEGGFSPQLNSNEEVFQLIIESSKSIGYVNNQDYKLAIDAAASEFYQNKKYVMKKDNKEITGDELIKYYLSLINKYQVYSFEDVFDQDDWASWSQFNSVLNPNYLLIGDDLLVTDVVRIKTGIEKKAINAVLIKPNQIGTIKETVDAIKLAKTNHMAVAVSHRSGETEDSFIADLAYACAADYLKTGAPCRSDRLAKYNRLIEIENKI